jgi:hypothetical protein
VPISINPKSITLANGTANDATQVESIQTDLFENDNTIANAVNNLTSGTDPFDIVKTDYIAEETPSSGVYIDSMRAKDGYVNLAPVKAEISSVNTTSETITTTTNHGITTGTLGRVRSLLGATIPGGLTESSLYYFRAPTTNTLTLHTSAADAASGANPVNLTSSGSGTSAKQIITNPTSFKEADFWVMERAFGRINGATRKILMDQDTPQYNHWGYRTGYYYGPIIDGGLLSSGGSPTLNQMVAVPFVCPTDTTFTRIGVNVTATGGTGVYRLGIWSANGAVPGSLLLDAGTVTTTSTGDKEISISQLLPMGNYFLSIALQVSGSPNILGLTNDPTAGSNALTGRASSSTTSRIYGYLSGSSVSGSLPSSFGTTTDLVSGSGNPAPYIWLRVV